MAIPAVKPMMVEASTQTTETVFPEKEKKWFTKEKVKSFAKAIFPELVYWGKVALAIVVTVVVVKLAIANPIVALALVLLGALAYRYRREIAYTATMYLCAFKQLFKVNKYTWFNTITPHIVLGAVPLENKEHGKTLKENLQITDVLSLNQDKELRATTLVSTPLSQAMWEKEGIQFTQIPVVNRETMSLDQLDKAVDIIAQTVQRKGKVYVHCNTGLERSAMVVIAYLIKYQKLSVEQAVKFVKRQRPSIDFDKPTQLTKLYEYRGYLTRPSYVESPKKSTTTSEAGTQF